MSRSTIATIALVTALAPTAHAASEATFVSPFPRRYHGRLVSLPSTNSIAKHKFESGKCPTSSVLFADVLKTDHSGSSSNDRHSLHVLLYNACTGAGGSSIDDITDRIASRIILPFAVPDPVVQAATRLVVTAMTNDLSPDLIERIGDAVSASAGYGDDEDDELHGGMDELAAEVAAELNAVVSLPILNEDQELVVLRSIVGATLAVLAFPDLDDILDEVVPHDPKEAVDRTIDAARGLLSGPEGRRKMAMALNRRVDFPFLNEEAEEVLLEKALKACAAGLERALPAALAEVLSGSGGAEEEGHNRRRGLEETKQFVSDAVNARVDIPGMNEEQEGWIVRNVVDIVIDLVVGDTEAELLLMDAEERRVELLGRREELRNRMESERRIFEAEQASLAAEVASIDKRLQSSSLF